MLRLLEISPLCVTATPNQDFQVVLVRQALRGHEVDGMDVWPLTIFFGREAFVESDELVDGVQHR